MKQIPEEGEELPPLLEAFQQLKYDPEENTADGDFCNHIIIVPIYFTIFIQFIM